ncbi:hypothetical protein LEMLEM_LOCUS27158 [Lemmus lemmus]
MCQFCPRDTDGSTCSGPWRKFSNKVLKMEPGTSCVLGKPTLYTFNFFSFFCSLFHFMKLFLRF